MSNLPCGGRGPCCHIGYAHRHCQHCDFVIATWYPHYSPYYPNVWSSASGVNTLQQALQAGHTHTEDGPAQ